MDDQLADEIAKRLAATEHARQKGSCGPTRQQPATVTALHRIKAQLAIQVVDVLRCRYTTK
jgi:hypothetical protein